MSLTILINIVLLSNYKISSSARRQRAANQQGLCFLLPRNSITGITVLTGITGMMHKD